MYLYLKDLKKNNVPYNWCTIYVGIEENYFEKNILTEHAVELMENGEDSELISTLAWGVEDEDLMQIMVKIKTIYVKFLEKDTDSWRYEYRKLRHVYLKKLAGKHTNKIELLDEIASFYDNFGYPEDMSGLINYMPQDSPTDSTDLLNRFNHFWESEKKNLHL